MEKTVGIQQYMFRDYLNDECQISETLQKIAAAGYDGVEVCSFLMQDAAFWKQKMQDEGLKVLAVHEEFENIYRDTAQSIVRAKLLETDYIVSAGVMQTVFEDSTQVRKLARRLNECGRQISESGLTFLFHNHNCEFVRTEKGTLPMDILLEETNPDYVKFEVDTYWISISGFTAMEWLDKIGTRIGFMHINDCRVCSDKAGTPIRTVTGAELGTGNLNLPALLEKAQSYGCTCEILETHDGWVHGSPFESMEISRKYLRKHFK